MNIDWVAGFMDGEGSIYVAKTTVRGYTSYRPRVGCSNTYQPVVGGLEDWFSQFGDPFVKAKKYPTDKNKTLYQVELVSWQGCRDACAALVDRMLIRDRQARVMIEWADYRLAKQAQLGKYRARFDEEDERLYDMISNLNKRGQA